MDSKREVRKGGFVSPELFSHPKPFFSWSRFLSGHIFGLVSGSRLVSCLSLDL